MNNKWLILRRLSQFTIWGLFLTGPLLGVWIAKGNLTSSLILDIVPLSDPYILLQTFAAGHVPELTAITGAVIVLGFYLLVGGRTYCSFVCPMNVVTDASRWFAKRLDLPKGWQPQRTLRLWLMAAVLVVAAVSGTMAWELLNPVTILHRALVFGFGMAWVAVLGVFLFDLLLSRRGWCGHICPMGAFYSLIGKFSIIRMAAPKRDACNDCMDCFDVCPEPHVISPALKGVGSPVISSGDCTNCGRCIDVCSKDVFSFSTRFNTAPPPAAERTDTSDQKAA